MSDAARRAIRSFIQGFVAAMVSSNIMAAFSTEDLVDWSILLKVVISAIAAGVLALLVYVQNALEDNTSFPALLKAPPSSGVNPVPEDGGNL